MAEQVRFEGARRSDLYIEREPVTQAAPAAGGPPVAPPSTSRSEAFVEPGAVPVAEASVRRQRAAVPVLEPEEDEAGDGLDAPATEGFRGWLNGMGFKLGPSAAEFAKRREADDLGRFEDRIRQSSWTRTVRVLVSNKKGNAGKTPSSIEIGGTLAFVRGGGVVVTEFSDDRGQLAHRAEGEPKLGIGELAKDIDSVHTRAQLAGYTVKQTSHAEVIGSTRQWREPLSYEDVIKVSERIGEFYTIQVMDTGNVYSSGPFTAAVELADVLVIPTMKAYDSVSEALELLGFLEVQGDAAARLAREAVVLMIDDGRPTTKVGSLRKLILDAGVTEERIFDVPFDAHVAERGEIKLGKLSAELRSTLIRVTAAVVEQINKTVYETAVDAMTKGKK